MDLNADIGEGARFDHELLALVTSANVACGAHAGDSATMHRTVERALELGVAIGAHPGYPDRENFGRRETGASATEIEASTRQQIEALREICERAGARLRYVKAHGALYHRAVHDKDAAAAIAAATLSVDAKLTILALPGSAMLDTARSAGLGSAREAFLDRAYNPDGTLVGRDRAEALISDADFAAERGLAIARGESFAAITGTRIRVAADSLCVHGDSPHALSIARAARAKLEEAGIPLSPFVH